MTRDREYRFVANLAGAQALQEGAVILRVRQYRWYAKISSVAPAVVRASSWSVDPPKDPPAHAIVEYRDVLLFTSTAGVTDPADAPGCGEAATDPAP